VKRRKLVAIAAATAAVALIASATMAGARVRQQTVRGVTDDSITVAGLGQSAFFADSQIGAQARFDEEKNGVFGRTITVTEFANDNSDPNTNLSEARRLVQQEGVFAILPLMSPVVGTATMQFLNQQKVPHVGWGIAQAWCKDPYGFPFTGCIVPPTSIPNTGSTWGELVNEYYKTQGEAKGSKGKTAAVITEDNDTGKEGLIEIEAQAKYGGKMKVTYGEAALPAPPAVIGDYSPFVNDIMTSNDGGPPDVVFVVTSFANTGPMSQGLLDAGFTGLLTNAVAYDPRLVAAAEGQTVFTQFNLPEDTSNAKMQKVVDSIKSSAGADAAISQGVLAGYWSADLFVKVLKKVGKNLTPEAFAKAASKFTYVIPGIIGPTKWPKAFTQGAPCGTLVQSNGTEYEIVVPYGCYHNSNYKTGKRLDY
jgi:ABC-type branched-subunit amino acid transport system substrate-binding protein